VLDDRPGVWGSVTKREVIILPCAGKSPVGFEKQRRKGAKGNGGKDNLLKLGYHG